MSDKQHNPTTPGTRSKSGFKRTVPINQDYVLTFRPKRKRAEKSPSPSALFSSVEQPNSDIDEKEKAALAIMELYQHQKQSGKSKNVTGGKDSTKTYQRTECRKLEREKQGIKVTPHCGRERHHSVVSSIDDLVPMISPCKKKDCGCGLLHCPLCEKDFFMPVRFKSTLWRHVLTHQKYSVQFENVICCLCRLNCSGCLQSHYHCPLCFQRNAKRRKFVAHLKTHERDYGQRFHIETRKGVDRGADHLLNVQEEDHDQDELPDEASEIITTEVVSEPCEEVVIDQTDNLGGIVVMDVVGRETMEIVGEQIDDVVPPPVENTPVSVINAPSSSENCILEISTVVDAESEIAALPQSESGLVDSEENEERLILQTEDGPVICIIEKQLTDSCVPASNSGAPQSSPSVQSPSSFIEQENGAGLVGGMTVKNAIIPSEVINEACVENSSGNQFSQDDFLPEVVCRNGPGSSESSVRVSKSNITNAIPASSTESSESRIFVVLNSSSPPTDESAVNPDGESHETADAAEATNTDVDESTEGHSSRSPVPGSRKGSISIKDLNELERFALENYFSENKNEPFEIQVRQTAQGTIEYPCRYCNIVKQSRHAIYRHYRRDHCEKRFMCTKCPVRYAQFTDLKRHMDTCKGKREVPSEILGDSNQCPVCGQMCSSRKCLRVHCKEVHSNKGTFYRCPTCDKAFAIKRYLQAHIKRHSASYSERKYSCETCGKGFMLKGHLKEHQLSHRSTADRSDRFQCDQCGKRFMRLNILRDHINLHEDKKPYACTQCSKAFAGRCSLAKHYTTAHSDARPYMCEICHKSFKFRYFLKAHEKSHQENRTRTTNEEITMPEEDTNMQYYLCSVCESTFQEWDDIVSHMMIHETQTDVAVTDESQNSDLIVEYTCDGGDISHVVQNDPNTDDTSPDVSQYLKQISPTKHRFVEFGGGSSSTDY